ncbi:MAG: sigma-54-dependent Fis family transcriptional regulator [Rhodomicrobium sp.]|nr:sigma-54-dependent Fis family transcriptional regulator [Rhodomicrobium sp.]
MSLEGRTIALIEDDPVMGESLLQSLSLEGARVDLYASASAALKQIAPSRVDLVVCDMRLPDTDGQSVFRRFGAAGDAPPFLFMTAYGDIDQAVQLMREGAADYLTKPFDMDVFMSRVESALRYPLRESECATLGISPAMRQIEQLLRRVAGIDSPVLITGETGTGKDVCARFLHQASGARGPFMAVNCAAIPGELLESELFGHEAGAFTGAHKRHIGYVERAGAGTLFLDEIGELALPLQAKLLRLLEDRQFFRVGGEQPVPFRARLVSATNADLGALMAVKRFRSDLYYRINVIEVNVPALRDRREDIPWLMEIFLREVAPDRKAVRGIGAQAEQAALLHGWPGNVRELRNRVERAVALSLSEWISPQDLFPETESNAARSVQASGSLADARESAEKHRIVAALAENSGQIAKTAEALGVSRTTLWEKIKRYGIAERE